MVAEPYVFASELCDRVDRLWPVGEHLHLKVRLYRLRPGRVDRPEGYEAGARENHSLDAFEPSRLENVRCSHDIHVDAIVGSFPHPRQEHTCCMDNAVDPFFPYSMDKIGHTQKVASHDLHLAGINDR